MRFVLTVILAAGILSCADSTPVPIHYGSDLCTSCKMTITEETYAAEIITKTGKAFKFDSPECMLGYVQGSEISDQGADAQLWVTDFVHPGHLIDARTAFYLHSKHLHSPMGLNVTAYATADSRDRARINYPGDLLSFNDVLKLSADY